MESIQIRYGEDVTLPIDTGSPHSVHADIFIGKPGETYVLAAGCALTNGAGAFFLSKIDTALPLGTYFYQVNVTDDDGYVSKFPSPEKSRDCEECESEFPKFIVCEALDEIEVS